MFHVFIDIDLCISKPCKHYGQCINLKTSYYCNCSSQYNGDHCEIGNVTNSEKYF